MRKSDSVAQMIRQKLTVKFNPTHLELDNESHMHSVPPGSESHFRLILVSDVFAGLTRVARQRLVNECLQAELKGSVHALSMRVMTPQEWLATGAQMPVSPQCLGKAPRR